MNGSERLKDARDKEVILAKKVMRAIKNVYELAYGDPKIIKNSDLPNLKEKIMNICYNSTKIIEKIEMALLDLGNEEAEYTSYIALDSLQEDLVALDWFVNLNTKSRIRI